MKKRLMVFVLALLGVVSIIATSPPPFQGMVISTRNNTVPSDLYSGVNVEENVFACLNEEVEITWYINASSGLLTAIPLGRLNPDIDQKQTSSSDNTFKTTVLGDVVVTLQVGEFRRSVNLALLSEDICQNFPVNLITDFLGTLQQTLPEVTTLPQRTLKLRWRDNALQAVLTGNITSGESSSYESSAPCQLFPDEDKLICSAGDAANPSLRLEGIITAEGFTGSYKGFDESTAGNVSFEGTFDFKKVEPSAQPQQ